MTTTAEKAKRLKEQTRRPSGPGALLADFLENTGMTQGDAAKRLNVSRQTVSDMVNDRRNLTPDMANRLAILCGDDSPEIWIRLQQQRDLWDALHMDTSAFANVLPYNKTTAGA